MKYKIEEIEGFETSNGMVRVFRVLEPGQKDFDADQVWLDGDLAKCVGCSGPLTAMKTSCKHARAVKRYAKRFDR